MNDIAYLEKYSKIKLKIQKYLILLACAFLDFSQKMLTFILNKYIINNIWIFNICFISIFEYCIMKRKLYKHQYLSSLIIIVLGIIATIIGLLEEEDNILIKLLLCVFIEIQYSLAIVLAKYLMDYRVCSPFEVTFYEGFFSLIVNSILLAIFTNYPLPDNDKYDDIFRIVNYDGKKYLDHFYATFNNMGVGEGFLFALSACGRLISNLFGHIVVKHYTSSHIILILVLGEIALAFKESTEIIEINVCDLEKNTRKNIYLREMLEGSNNENYKDILNTKDGDNERVELSEDVEIEIKREDRGSCHSNDS